jgi:predicted secreted Zn-dependent protease
MKATHDVVSGGHLEDCLAAFADPNAVMVSTPKTHVGHTRKRVRTKLHLSHAAWQCVLASVVVMVPWALVLTVCCMLSHEHPPNHQ